MSIKEKIEIILNDKRAIILQQMCAGKTVDYQELLFQIDEEIREVLKDSDDND